MKSKLFRISKLCIAALALLPAIASTGISLGAATAAENAPVKLEPSDTERIVVEKAVSVRPSHRQLEWQRIEFGAFLHFGVNTFTNKEWGDGTEDPSIFNPKKFDARQWVAALKAAGVRQVIITAKHHDGFCLWPSAYTDHSVKNSPWRDGKGDVVREVADAAREAGMKFGFYLSPWDRHDKTFGTAAYNDYYINQLRELLTGYGEISEVWMDAACGEMDPRCKDLKYDWPRIFATVRELQPNAAMSIYGPDVRWIGNEGGITRASEWSVTPDGFEAMAQDIGSRKKLMEAAARGANLKWYPAQVDTSIRPGWFYHKGEDYMVRDYKTLAEIYFNAVGGNSELLLNVPPDQNGLLAANDVKSLKKLGEYLSATFEKNFAAGAAATAEACGEKWAASETLDGADDTARPAPAGCVTATYEYALPAPVSFNMAMLQERISQGQRIEAFALDAWLDGGWKEIGAATTVGYKKLLRFKTARADKVRVRITAARAAPELSEFALHATPDGV